MTTTIAGVTYTDTGGVATVTAYDGVIGNITILSSVDIGGTTFPVTSINGFTAFRNSDLISISIPSTITTLPNGCFRGCTSLTTITFPDNMTILGSGCFNGCTSLNNVVLPPALTTLNIECFIDCTSLTTMTWLDPTTLNSIGTRIFLNTPSMDVTYYTSYNELGLTSQNLQSQYAFGTSFHYPARCFLKDTGILTFNLAKGKEEYVAVQDLEEGDMVKTISDTKYVPIVAIKHNKIYNSGDDQRTKDRLYLCDTASFARPNESTGLMKDLVITGAHSVLVCELSAVQRSDIEKTLGEIFVTDGHYRLPAFLDERTVPYPVKGEFEIYHFALENSNYYGNYGVFANGLLVESASEFHMENWV